MKPTEVTCYQCQECQRIYADPKVAEKCCAPCYCEDCNAALSPKWYRTVCENCNLNRQFERAEKLDKWEGWIHSEHVSGDNDVYFRDTGELIEYCHDTGTEIPPWAFVCKEQWHEIDIDSALERMTEDAYEDAADDLVDVAELEEFIREWNAKQNIITYYPDWKKVVLITGKEVQ